jgi:hypothetical protein
MNSAARLLKYEIHTLIQVTHLAEKITVKNIKVISSQNFFNMKDAVKYLVIPDPYNKLIAKTKFEAVTSAKFNDFVLKYVNAYTSDGKMPPVEIAGAILNIADDLLSGREPTLKAGDYITIQNYMQSPTRA